MRVSVKRGEQVVIDQEPISKKDKTPEELKLLDKLVEERKRREEMESVKRTQPSWGLCLPSQPNRPPSAESSPIFPKIDYEAHLP